jgi:YHS domain-containing protein
MTAARRKRKPYQGGPAIAVAVVLAISAGLHGSIAATTEQIVVDWHSGLAIAGYDPVAYFTDGKSLPGSGDWEYRYAGAIWRFCNLGNRAAFVDHPDVYMPQFGGYDPVGVARGVAVAGNPNVWMISGERLYLFYDRERLQTFIANPDLLLADAQRKWPDLKRTLNP